MAINVRSEIKPLKKVLLHRPGKELENLVPDTLERLLFDDIPYLKVAQQEHDAFAKVLKDNGVEVVYLEDLMADVMKDEKLRKQFIDQFIKEANVENEKYKTLLIKFFNDIKDAKELVLKTMEGVNIKELDYKTETPTLVDYINENDRFLVDPMPNLYFTRDPFACIGNGVSLNRMYSVTRNRETIYGEYIFNYHPEYKGKVEKYFDRYNDSHIEGGDILNINDKVLAIGISQRTLPEAIEQIAKNVFSSPTCKIQTILAFDIPSTRAFMHLDTVFTQIDYDKFTIHPGILGPLKVYEITKGKDSEHISVIQVNTDLESILEKHLGIDKVELIKCGGNDRVAAEREQWNDGSNTLCIAPGVIIVYERNNITNEILRNKGLKVLEIPSAELSRGRGGPRCMSMPLIRED